MTMAREGRDCALCGHADYWHFDGGACGAEDCCCGDFCPRGDH